MENTAIGILKKIKLRHTDTRENILKGFLHKTTALSHGDLETYLQEGYDRVTIYRTLKTFLDKGIIHKILDDNGGVKYALCRDQCSTGNHSHNHVHFKCSSCGETFCLEKFLIPEIILPEGYQRKEINVLVQGVCPKCN